ncbi:MAG: 6-carboxytetrahydropterin synthase [Muribaculaceae bacterium]|nr:6-carboxytetrahydropterin synthase [Muribaculaceae bacterium]
MYYIKKRIEISGSHRLELPYESKCTRSHGHNWILTVHCRSAVLTPEGMVTDFTHIKQQLTETLDHRHFNDVLPFNPTAENIARWVCELVPNCYRVDVQESEGNIASYEID